MRPVSYTHLVDKYDVLKGLKAGGSFLLNSVPDAATTCETLPAHMKAYLAKNKINFYIINATKIAAELGLGSRTNTIMQSAFFKIANVIPFDKAVEEMKKMCIRDRSWPAIRSIRKHIPELRVCAS